MFPYVLLVACLVAPADETIPLFDGTSLEGWSGNAENWYVEHGMIVGATRPGDPLGHNEYLFWDGIASDFVLEMDIRVLGGNTGIQYRSQRLGEHDVEGYQADLDADNQYTGALYETNGRGIMCLRGQQRAYLFQDNRRDLGTLPGVDSPPVQPHAWNRYRITADGPHLVHHINGRMMAEIIDEDPALRRRDGRIALQLHTGAPMRVEVRDITIRPLNGTSIVMRPPQPRTATIEPEWIWCSATAVNDQTCTLTRTFEVSTDAPDAQLRITCDNRFTAELDSRQIASGTDWTRPVTVDLPGGLEAGSHVLRVRGQNESGPAGLLAELTWTDAGGITHHLVTDQAWQVEPGGEAATGFGPASNPRGPWPDVFAKTPARPSESHGQIEVPPGFSVETVYEARADEGSWVAMAFDEQGRVIVSAQYGDMFRLTLPGSPGGDVLVEPIDLDIGGAQGLLVAHGSLYVMVTRNGDNGGGLWRLRDTTGDDQYDSMKHLVAWGAGNEHGNHALVLGPDDMIYVVQGNHTPLPPRVDPASPHRNWEEDDLLQRMWDANGHAVGVMAPGGVVMRTDADASQFEIIAGGLRNSYDLAFNETGDLFTWDSDMEWDLGTPWYRPPRALHVTSGGEFGWRGGTAKWPDWYPDSLPTMLDMPQGSPTGMVFGGDGNFPEPWRSSLLLADWTYGRVFAVHLEEDGAGWHGRQEIFASGRPFNVSDLAFGPDGHLYLITGGRGTHSALYRVLAMDVPEGMAPERTGEAAALRAQRRALESLHGEPVPERLDEILAGLRSDDRIVQYAARIALERLEVDAWRQTAFEESHPRAALVMLLALARYGEPEDRDRLVDRALELGMFTDDPGSERAAMRAIALATTRLGSPSRETNESIRSWLRPVMDAEDIQASRAATELMVHLQATDLPDRLVPSMESARTQEDALHAALLLRLVNDGWNDDLRRRYIQWLRDHHSLAGGRSIGGFVKAIELAAMENWDAATTDRIMAMLAQPAEPSRDALPRVNAWTMAALEPHLDDMHSGRHFALGRQAYRDARCLDCHRFHGAGGSTGPDLTGIGARFSDRDLLEALVVPSKVIPDQYQATMVIRTDDTIDTGRLLESNDEQVVLDVDPYGYEPLAIPRSEVAEMVPSPVSTMPVGLLDILELEEVLDLMAYLRSSGDPSHPSFSSGPGKAGR